MLRELRRAAGYLLFGTPALVAVINGKATVLCPSWRGVVTFPPGEIRIELPHMIRYVRFQAIYPATTVIE